LTSLVLFDYNKYMMVSYFASGMKSKTKYVPQNQNRLGLDLTLYLANEEIIYLVQSLDKFTFLTSLTLIISDSGDRRIKSRLRHLDKAIAGIPKSKKTGNSI